LLATSYFTPERGGALTKVVFDKQQERYLVANEKDYISTHNHPSADDPEQEEEDGDDDVNAEDDNDSDDSDTDTNNRRPYDAPAKSQKKPDKFPNTLEAFKFVVNVLKRYQLHFVLDVSLDPMQLGSVFRKLWPSIGHQLWKQRSKEELLSKYFPEHRIISPLLDHDIYNPDYLTQICESKFVLKEDQIWFDFQEYLKGDYRKQNLETQGIVFIPKHGIVPKLSAAHAKELSSAEKKQISGKTGKSAAILCHKVKDFKMFLEVCLGWRAFCHYSYLLEPDQRQNMNILNAATRRMIEMFDQFVYRGHTTNDTRTCKCHSHLHSTHTYQEYGDPRQYNAGKG
jgi:hypothetical protein